MTPREQGRTGAARAVPRNHLSAAAAWLAGGLHRPLLVLLVAVALAFPMAAWLGERTRPDLGSLAVVPMTTLVGEAATTEAWMGEPLVLNIWATWCPPCRVEMPALDRLSGMLAPDGIRVAALSVDEDANLVREFVLKYELGLPIAIAESVDEAMKALGVMALPLTLYVDADGRIVDRYLGERDWADEAVAREVRKALGAD